MVILNLESKERKFKTQILTTAIEVKVKTTLKTKGSAFGENEQR